MAQVRDKLSLEEFRALPEQKPYLEYWNAEIVQKIAPQKSHRGGSAGPEASIEFLNSDDKRELVPDVAYWAPGKPVGGPIMQPPTLAVEVRSVGQSVSMLRSKCRYYLANGVDVARLVDPESRTVEVFDEGRDGVVLREDDVLECEALPVLSVELRGLFAVVDE